MTQLALTVTRSPLAPARCAYCHDELGREPVTCTGCATLVHEECQTDRCLTLGCESLAPWEWTAPAVSASRRGLAREWLLAASLFALATALGLTNLAPAEEVPERSPQVLASSHGLGEAAFVGHGSGKSFLPPGAPLKTETSAATTRIFACGIRER